MTRILLLPLLSLLACSRGGAPADPGAGDGEDLAAAPTDLGDGDHDARGEADLRAADLAGGDLRAADLAGGDLRAADLAAPPDAAFPGAATIDIFVSNVGKIDVVPMSLSVPHGVKARLSFRNRSVDYEVDVWMSYGGGYLMLKQGATWADPIDHCATPLPHDEYADITAGASKYRFYIHCL